MKYFFEPINLSDWNIFKKVNTFSYQESFYGTKEMKIGDMLFLYVTSGNKEISSGIYGNGIIISEPDDNNSEQRIRVNVRIKYIRFDEPILKYDICKQYIKQFRSVHRIDETIMSGLMKTALVNIIND